jgi:hypothetical protein
MVRMRRRPCWLRWGRPPPSPHFAWCGCGGGHGGCAGGILPLLLTPLCAGADEGMVVVLEASSPSSSLCLVRMRRRPCWLCWRRLPPPPHSAWCGCGGGHGGCAGGVFPLLPTLLGAGEGRARWLVVVLEASSPSSLFCLMRVRRMACWLCWGRPPPSPHFAWCGCGGGHGGCAGGVLPLLLTLHGADEEEAMLVALGASFPSSLFCLMRMRRRAWWLCWRRPPPPPHSAWCG